MSGDLEGTGCIANAHAASAPGKGPCEHCGRPRCNGTSRTSGERCRRNPIPGGWVCVQNHGGAAPQVQAKAAENLVGQQADKLVRAIWPVEGVVPVTNPVAALQRLAGQLQYALDVLGDGLDFTELEARPVQAAAWVRVVRESRQLLSDMERLGIAGKLVEIEASRIRLMAGAVSQLFEMLDIPEDKRESASAVFFAALRADAGVELPAGGAA